MKPTDLKKNTNETLVVQKEYILKFKYNVQAKKYHIINSPLWNMKYYFKISLIKFKKKYSSLYF